MSLVKYEEKRAKEGRQLPPLQTPLIDYSYLEYLNSDHGLQSRYNPETTEEAHQHFMENYHRMFIKPAGPPTDLPDRKGSKSRASHASLISHATGGYPGGPVPEPIPKLYPVDKLTHDVRDYLPLLHKQRKSEDPQVVRAQNVKALRKLLRKYPFERTGEDIDKMYKILKTFPVIADQVSGKVLKELCIQAQLDVWKEPDFTVFGNFGFHLILKGSVEPQCWPHLKSKNTPDTVFRSPTPPPPAKKTVLKVGDAFGTLVEVPDKQATSRTLSVLTLEPCEFLRIRTTGYQRVIEQIEERDQTVKTDLVSSCPSFKFWKGQPLLKLSELIEWMHFSANTVLVSEGFKAPFIGFIKQGDCHVLRQVEVKHTLPNGKQEKRVKQVVMGKLSPCESFGEISVLLDEPITCSIVSATAVELGVITQEKLKALDDLTLQLLKQSCERTFGTLTQDDIYEEYMQQELKREWNEFKHNVVIDTINTRGVRPGYGKWAK